MAARHPDRRLRGHGDGRDRAVLQRQIDEAGLSQVVQTKAAVVNLPQALADEWLSDGLSGNVIDPERTRTPMRTQAFGARPEHTLLQSRAWPPPRWTCWPATSPDR